MAWYEDVRLPASLHPGVVSLRAREIWGHKSVPAASFRLTDNHLAYNWGGHGSCGDTACPMIRDPRAPCLLADDQWAWIPKAHAGAYYTSNAGCDREEARRSVAGRGASSSQSSPLTVGRQSTYDEALTDLPLGTGAQAAVGRRISWQSTPFKTLYNGEGLLTARLLQLRVPMEIVPAALRFHPIKKGTNWNGFTKKPLPCMETPCKDANKISRTCAPTRTPTCVRPTKSRATPSCPWR